MKIPYISPLQHISIQPNHISSPQSHMWHGQWLPAQVLAFSGATSQILQNHVFRDTSTFPLPPLPLWPPASEGTGLWLQRGPLATLKPRREQLAFDLTVVSSWGKEGGWQVELTGVPVPHPCQRCSQPVWILERGEASTLAFWVGWWVIHPAMAHKL